MDTPFTRHPENATVIPARADSAWAGAPAAVAERLGKAGGAYCRALTGLTFRVNQGEFFGVVGPRGAGKTTLLRVLATLLHADAGRLTIFGFDSQIHAAKVQALIGYVGQSTGVDPLLTGRENIQLMARLHGLKRRDASQRADRMLALLDLTTMAECKVQRFPHGARKRLAVACALAHRPRLLLLDDPTDGIAPQDHDPFWQQVRSAIQDDNTAIFLATQQLDAAESMCARVAIMDGGKIIASGTPAELKAQVGGVTVAVRLSASTHVAPTALLLEHLPGVHAVWSHLDRVEIAASGANIVPAALRLLEEHEIPVRDIMLSKPSLDEVFFRHTGRNIRDVRELPASGSTVPGRR
jgi:ABC-type multidrug transport system ATPase subunit